MKRVQNEESATRKECYMKKVQHEKSSTQKKQHENSATQ